MADIRFDVSNLTYKKFLVLDQSSTTFDGSASEVLSLPSGTYTFRHPDIAAEFTFEVTPDGFINFSAAHDGFLSGRGTSTLLVRGFTISLDARTLSHDLVPLALAVLLARDRTHVLTLLPAKGYAFLPSSQLCRGFPLRRHYRRHGQLRSGLRRLCQWTRKFPAGSWRLPDHHRWHWSLS